MKQMWRIRKWSFHCAVARQAPFLEQCSICVSTLRQTALYHSTFETDLFNCRSEIVFWKAGIVAAVLVATGWQLAAGRMLFPCFGILLHSVFLLSVMLGYTFINS